MLSSLARVKSVLTKRRTLRIPSMQTVVHKGEHFAHMTYLGLVSVETRYWYGKVAGVMLVIAVVSLFIHEEVE
jgi:hypothetical protein